MRRHIWCHLYVNLIGLMESIEMLNLKRKLGNVVQICVDRLT